MRLELRNVYRAFGGKRVLSDVSLTVEQGDFCALIGPTGCGKTTLLRISDLLDTPDSGRVLLDGVDCAGCRGRGRTMIRRRASMVMQRPFMLSGTVEKNIRFGPGVRGKRLTGDEVAEVLAATGLTGMEGRNARTLSGGEMQKVAIARAVVTKPELLFLDEPFNSVDQGAKPELRTLVGRLHREMGMTVLMATHDLADALALSNRTAVLSDGRLMQAGETGPVFGNPANLFVASFIGMKNIIPVAFENQEAVAGELNIHIAEKAEGNGFIHIPPEVITISLERPDSSQRNAFNALITHIEETPMYDTVHLRTGGLALQAVVTPQSTGHLGLQRNSRVWISFKATSVRILA
jgi:tungstate transport system ATP-binding protein